MNDARGFTLIEMVLVIIIVGILAAAVAPMAFSSVRAYNATLNSLGTLDKLRYATERLVRELREVSYDRDNTKYVFATMSTTAPRFTKAVSASDPVAVEVTVGYVPPTAPATTAVTLAYSTPAVVPAPVLTDHVSALAFAYYMSDGITITTDPVLVRYVEISLTLTPPGSLPYSQRTRVELKNR